MPHLLLCTACRSAVHYQHVHEHQLQHRGVGGLCDRVSAGTSTRVGVPDRHAHARDAFADPCCLRLRGHRFGSAAVCGAIFASAYRMITIRPEPVFRAALSAVKRNAEVRGRGLRKAVAHAPVAGLLGDSAIVCDAGVARRCSLTRGHRGMVWYLLCDLNALSCRLHSCWAATCNPASCARTCCARGRLVSTPRPRS